MIRFTREQLRRRLERLPMLRVLIPVAAGILLAAWWQAPAWWWVAAAALCGVAALGFRSGLYAAAMLLFGAAAVTDASLTAPRPPLHRKGLYRLRIEERPVRTAFGETATARIEAWCDSEKGWQQGEGLVRLYADSVGCLPGAGSRMVVPGRLRAVAGAPFRREVGVLGIHAWNGALCDTAAGSPGWSGRLHAALLRRLGKLRLPPDRKAVVEAMTAGERRALDPALRSAYNRSGAAHLLAISGLHIGVVLAAVNLLLWFLPLVRHGHRLRNLLAVGFVWFYVAAIGAPPSALRAACMCTILQYALAFSAPYAGLNGLFGAASLLLLLEPLLLFDLGFQLSCLAVFAILAWGFVLVPPLRRGWLRWLAGLMAAGCCATLATAPLIARAFGIFPPAGILINPLLVLTAQGIIIAGVLWMCLPLALWQPLAEGILSLLTALQNGLVRRVAGWEHAAIEVHPSAAVTVLCYLLFFGATLLLWSAAPPPAPLLPHDDT